MDEGWGTEGEDELFREREKERERYVQGTGQAARRGAENQVPR